MSKEQSKPVNIKHDPLVDIEQQQKALNIAIHQHENDAQIRESLKKQKDDLGELAKQYKSEQEFLSKHTDGGGAFRSNLHHAGNLGDYLVSSDEKVSTITYRINDFDDSKKKKEETEK